MIPYQRYLREKKEIESQEIESQEVEEARAVDRLDRSKLNPIDGRRLQAFDNGATPRPRLTANQQAATVGVDTGAAARARALASARGSLSKEKENSKNDKSLPKVDTPTSSTATPTSSTATPTDKSNNLLTPNKKSSTTPVSPDSVRGNSITELITSAGGDPSSARGIINIVKNILRKENVVLRDNSFLS